jgi:hypothetical protein
MQRRAALKTYILIGFTMIFLLPNSTLISQGFLSQPDLDKMKWKPVASDFTHGDTLTVNGIRHIIAPVRDHGIFVSVSNMPGKWFRPNTILFPRELWWMDINDVVYWRGAHQKYYRGPEDEYVILLDNAGNPPYAGQSGIYQWISFTNSFFRLDQPHPNASSKVFDRIYHHKTNGEILYVVADDGIYQLTGPYSSMKIEKLPDGTKLVDLLIDR